MSGPLDDVLVIDLTRALAGPHAAMMLGDLGARVIKVETPVGGDDSRGWGPPFVGPDDDPQSTYFMSANRNKESVTADLKSDEGKDLLRKLVERADVLMENFRPGVLDRLGFSTERLHELNPRLVIMSITGFGHDGPEADRSGYDQIAQGEAGFMSITGPDADTPTKAGVPIGDLLAGMYGAYGVVAALHERDRTGRGRVVRTSLLSSLVSTQAYLGTMWTVGHQVPLATGNQHASICPYGLFHTADAPVQVACGSEKIWQTFAGLLGIDPVDERFASNPLRVRNRAQLEPVINERLVEHGAEYWLALFRETGIPAGKVRTIDDVFGWEQTRSQGLVIGVDHAVAGPIELPGPPLRFDDNPYAGGRKDHLPPPLLGEHNEAIRAWLDEIPAADTDGTDGAES